MNFALLTGAALLFAAFMKRQKKALPDPTDDRAWLESMIRSEARTQGVPEPVALATAWVESRMDPDAEGDRNWHLNEKRFDAVVPRQNPHRWQRALWHSYGLFQLLAPYHVKANESPLVLLDPAVNIQRGVAHLACLLKRHNGDLDAVRLAYTGQPVGSHTDLAERTLHKWRVALARYGYDDPIV